MDKITALRIVQKGLGETDEVEVYVTAMTLGQIKKYDKVDEWTTSNQEGYQRPRIQRRLSELARYVMQEQGVLPHLSVGRRTARR